MSHAPSAPGPVPPPRAPALVVGIRGAAWLGADGRAEEIALAEALLRVRRGATPFVCHARAAARRLNTTPFPALDLLELFAFVRPARFCLPTPKGLALALGLPLPATLLQQAQTLAQAARALIGALAGLDAEAGAEAAGIARAMERGGWTWAPAVLAALGAAPGGAGTPAPFEALKVWQRLPEWEEGAPEPPPGSRPLAPEEAAVRLAELLGGGAEDRPGQVAYARETSAAFAPRDRADQPRLVLAEAGTGVGKTLGYIAPASVWTDKNGGPVWISTFTRNLQRQLDAELDRLYPAPAEKAEKVVVRKGRENYFCLLNFEEAAARLPMRLGAHARQSAEAPGEGGGAVALGLMARFARATRDGDMVGGDFPAWLADLLGQPLTLDLTDTRGECIYAACAHYRKCFIEHSVRKARRAKIVVANHALVMVQAARGGDGAEVPTRYVFDEGHHLFQAADSAFSAHLSGREGAELRRWIVGSEEGGRSRSRGLKARIEDLVADDKEARARLEEILRAARSLPGPGWLARVASDNPLGPAEAFLARVREQVYARDEDWRSPYDLEAATNDPVPGLLEAAAALEAALGRLAAPMARLARSLAALLDAEAANLDTQARNRIEAVARGLERRGLDQLAAWRDMLKALAAATPPEFVDWFGVERAGGRDVDVGLYRHWLDPMRPFAETVLAPAHGALVTSATLADRTNAGAAPADDGWAAALLRTGARHLAGPPLLSRVPSPFDYRAQTRILVVTDVERNRPDQVAAAYRELFLASGGGGLGLFTAISRLKQVYERIALPLEEAGLVLYAQHVDPLDTGTLVDIFRAEEDSCLLGTDAVRDGVDVPGRSLRLIVFDRVPWPRPDILHRARKAAFGGAAYDDMLTRLKLKQAYGRLVRRADDRGVFAMLDRALPSRLASAFPEGVPVRRVGLMQAVVETRAFLARAE